MQVISNQFTSDSPLSNNLTNEDAHSKDDRGYAEYFRLAGIKNVRSAEQPEKPDITDENSDSAEHPAEGGLLL
jgi:hypothetical protein